MKKAVIIIARNEGEWTYKTAHDFKKTMPDAQIIGIDDGGKNIWTDFVKVHKTKGGIGVGMCRRKGVELADADVICVTDGHVLHHRGDINKAWELAMQGYVVNSTTRSIVTGKEHGNGRRQDLKTHVAKNVRVPEGFEVGLIGGIYFMRKDVALEVIAPTPNHGANEQIMTCAAFSLGHKIYTLPSLVFAHLYKKKFNYTVTGTQQQRNKRLLEWWFFGKLPPQTVNEIEKEYHGFIKEYRVLNAKQLTEKIDKMNKNLSKHNTLYKKKK